MHLGVARGTCGLATHESLLSYVINLFKDKIVDELDTLFSTYTMVFSRDL